MSEQRSRASATVLLAAVCLVAVAATAYFFVLRVRHAHVSGRVTLNDQPVAGAQVIFLGADEATAAPLVTATDEAGHYRLTGNSDAGVPVGRYHVLVTKEALKDGTLPAGEQLEQARASGKLHNILPGIYADRTITPLEALVQSGSNTVDLFLH